MKDVLTKFPAYRRVLAEGRPKVAVVCHRCGLEEVAGDKPGLPPHVFAKRWRQRGWVVLGDGAKATCVACQRRPAVPEAQPVEVAEALGRQQAAEQRRVASLARQIAAEHVAAEHAESPLDKVVRLLASVPAGGPSGRRDWLAALPVVTEVAVELLRAKERSVFRAEVTRRSGVNEVTLRMFEQGHRKGANLTIEWPELVAGIRAAGLEPTPRRTGEAMSKEVLRAQAKMFELLREHFDGDGTVGTYEEGWSDLRVGEESGLSAQAVANAREAVLGRIREDPRIAALDAELRELRRKSAADLADLSAMFDNVRADLSRRLQAAEVQLAKLRERP